MGDCWSLDSGSRESPKWGLSGHPSRSLEGSGASQGNKSSQCPKPTAVFCPCPMNQPEVKLKGFELTLLAEEISGPSNITFVSGVLGITIMKLHRDKERLRQKQIFKILSLRKKGVLGNSAEVKAYAGKGKKRPEENGIKGAS